MERYAVIQMDTELIVGELVETPGPKSANEFPAGDYLLCRAVRVKEVSAPAMSQLGRLGMQTIPTVLPFLPTAEPDDETKVVVPVTDRQWRCLITKEQYDKFRGSFRKRDPNAPSVVPASQMPPELSAR